VIEDLRRDIQYALRSLWHTPAFTAIAILTLALGIGTNTALFSAVNGLLLRTLAVSHPETLVRIQWAGANDMFRVSGDYGTIAKNAAGEDLHRTFSYSAYKAMLSANQTLTDIAIALPAADVNVIYGGTAEVASSLLVSGNYFDLLGISAQIGRVIQPEDDRDSATPVVVISDAYWSRRFGRNTDVLGKTVTLGTISFTIVGVAPKNFSGVMDLTSPPRDITAALVMDREMSGTRLIDGTDWSLPVFGRLRPGVTMLAAKGNLEGTVQEAARNGWSSYLATLTSDQRALPRNQNRTAVPHLEIASASRGIYEADERNRKSAMVFSVVVGLVLVIVCANVANLLLSRAAGRQKEIAVRLSMGASRGRLIRQILTESFLLSAMGGVVGMLVGYWSRQLLPFGQDSPMDWHVIAFVTTLCIATGLAFGVFPAIRATRVDAAAGLKTASRTVIASRLPISRALLVGQVALSVVVLVGAGLFIRTLRNLRNVDAGFNTSNLIVLRVNPRMNGYNAGRIGNLYERLQEELSRLPGVTSVSHSRQPLLSGSSTVGEIHVEGQAASNPKGIRFWFMTVSPEFFQTHEIALIQGRGIEPQDLLPNAPPVGVINETAARRYFPGENPIGKRFGFEIEKSDYRIVGIVRDTKYNNVRAEIPPTIYNPFPGETTQSASFEIRTATVASSLIAAVRAATQRVDPALPVASIRTQSELAESGFTQERFFAMSYTLFGGLALLLASIGLFGLMSYNVARRTNEIGIRMALGAPRWHVLAMVLSESLVMVGVGIVIGIGVALAAGRFVTTMLFGLEPADGLTLVVVVATMLAVSLLAGYLPARRASKVDPMIALRYD
jgi:predicted permease